MTMKESYDVLIEAFIIKECANFDECNILARLTRKIKLPFFPIRKKEYRIKWSKFDTEIALYTVVKDVDWDDDNKCFYILTGWTVKNRDELNEARDRYIQNGFELHEI
jgi:hypothetical protein